MTGVLVVGVGNAYRRDDAAGLEAARQVRALLPPGATVVESEGEPTRLLSLWEGAEAVFVADAVRSGGEPGAVRRIDLRREELPPELFRGSTHHVSFAETVELARALGRLPGTAVLYAIEGSRFEAGEGLEPEVARGAADAAERIVEEVRRCTSGT